MTPSGDKLVGEIILRGIKIGEEITLRGIGRTSPRTIFPLQHAEDNPVISWWGITFE